ncbi:hypothetical protein PCANB_002936 [Pneumocystis canis]|nr:hypothetical protein PCANB_002936 [Pneumocystis canis]
METVPPLNPSYEKFSKKKDLFNLSSSPLYHIYQDPNEKNSYITPEPSSSTVFYSTSSPEYKYNFSNEFPSLYLNESSTAYIGRSSQSCTLSISRNNRFISRIHAKFEYHMENKAIYITCLGWNGMLLYVQTENEPRKLKKNQISVVEWKPDIGPIIVEIAGSRSQILWPMSLEIPTDNETDTDETYSICINDENIPPSSQKICHHLELHRDKSERIPLKELFYEDIENTRIFDSSVFSSSNDSLQSASLDNNDIPINDNSGTYSNFLSTNKIDVFPDNPQSLSSNIDNSNSKDDFINPDLLDSVLTILAFSPLSAVPSSTLTHLFPNTFLREDIEKWLRNAGQFIAEIKREGKDASGKPLENEWYYVPEKDDNEERRSKLQPFIKPIRQSRKTHKQYYWKKPRLLASNNIGAFTSIKKKIKKCKN